MKRTAAALLFALVTGAPPLQAATEPPDYGSWPVLANPFESTSGGGVMIDGYRPVVSGKVCATDFTVRMPDGATFANEITFDAVPIQGGILCTAGRWRAKDGGATGTTPFEVFIRDGVVRRSPPG